MIEEHQDGFKCISKLILVVAKEDTSMKLALDTALVVEYVHTKK